MTTRQILIDLICQEPSLIKHIWSIIRNVDAWAIAYILPVPPFVTFAPLNNIVEEFFMTTLPLHIISEGSKHFR